MASFLGTVFVFVFVSGKDSDAELQGLLTQLTQTKTAENLPTAEEDKIRSWQASQITDQSRNEKTNSRGNDDRDEVDMVYAAKPEENSKKTKKKKAKNKRSVECESQNGEKGNRYKVSLSKINCRRHSHARLSGG